MIAWNNILNIKPSTFKGGGLPYFTSLPAITAILARQRLIKFFSGPELPPNRQKVICPIAKSH